MKVLEIVGAAFLVLVASIVLSVIVMWIRKKLGMQP